MAVAPVDFPAVGPEAAGLEGEGPAEVGLEALEVEGPVVSVLVVSVLVVSVLVVVAPADFPVAPASKGVARAHHNLPKKMKIHARRVPRFFCAIMRTARPRPSVLRARLSRWWASPRSRR